MATTLYGASGDDYLRLSEFQAYFAGDGNDSVSAGMADTVHGEAGNDTLYTNEIAVSINGGIGDDILIFDESAINGTALGDDGNDVILILSSTLIQVDGESGNDKIFFVDYSIEMTINGGIGDDNLIALPRFPSLISIQEDLNSFEIYGGDGQDRIDISAGQMGYKVFGEVGFDTIYGGAGADTIDGGADNDSLVGGAGNDVIDTGSGGADTVLAGGGDDVIVALTPFAWPGHALDGGPGADNITISGQGGGVTMSGGSDADRFVIDFDHDPSRGIGGWSVIQDFNAGEGDRITLKFAQGVTPETYVYDSPHGLGLIFGVGAARYEMFLAGKTLSDYDPSWISFAETVPDMSGNDTLTGGAGNDSLDGGAGADVINAGRGGADTVLGGAGSDTITALSDFVWPGNSIDGGADNDRITISGLGGGVTMAGGTGRDQFIVDFTHDLAQSVGGWTHIQDFDPEAGEHVTLSIGGSFTPDLYAYDSLHGLSVIVGDGAGNRFELFFTGKTLADYSADWLVIV